MTALYTQDDRMKSLRVPYNTLEKRIKNKTFILKYGGQILWKLQKSTERK